MSQVLSVRLEEELWERVHSQQVQPRQVITEALLHYFRYKDGDTPETEQEETNQNINVYTSKQQLPDGSYIIDKDIEWAKLEMDLEILKSKLENKEEIIDIKEGIIDHQRKEILYLQTQTHIMRVHFMPADIGFLAGLLPAGKKAKRARVELDELEKKFIMDEETENIKEEKKKTIKVKKK